MVRFLTTTTALLALLTGFTAATPITKRAMPPITPNTQSCIGKQELVSKLSYTVQIGVSYANGAGCQHVLSTLGSAVMSIPNDKQVFEAYVCWDDGNGNTLLEFTTYHDRGWKVNEALSSLYPMVNGFNCPEN
ncbi:hypothetical protein LTR56_013131 [Elasticomyces elasticus]|nr:hypothetical protein LTR56_013131 [Elasticomyces elasticus]KAK3656693.1 hypothetical protein LTR22_009672 [Elasticomyces elasticus]KAK4921565.1 hypothetical protein LTR49_011035 [Elasticomyces elasticus]KAK5760253.1 hypothetical protein LTS12_009637 [Elasticomyces elasticus]